MKHDMSDVMTFLLTTNDIYEVGANCLCSHVLYYKYITC